MAYGFNDDKSKVEVYPADEVYNKSEVDAKETQINNRVNNIIAGEAPSAQEIIDARLGADGVTYPSLGDAIRGQVTDLKSELGYSKESIVLAEADLEQNGISTATGGNSVATNRIKTKSYQTKEIDLIKIASGFQINFYGWKNDEYLGKWDGTAFTKVAGGSWTTGTSAVPKFSEADYTKYKIVIAKTDNSDLTPEDGNNVLTLIVESYLKIDEIDEATSKINGLWESLDAFTNIADPDDVITGSAWSGVNAIYANENYYRQEIPVKPNTKYTISDISQQLSWFTNDNNDNLGNVPDGTFTTPNNCTKIRVSQATTITHSAVFVVLEGEHEVPSVNPVTYPYGEVFTKVDEIETSEELLPLTTVSVFETLGAIGDSFTSGGIYGVAGVTGGSHYSVSWPQILARRCGLTATNYSKGAIDISAWLSDTAIGLPKLLEDDPKQLYVIMLGINSEKQISDPTQNAEIGTTADIDLNDPTQNSDTFCGHYGTMVSKIIEHAPSAKIILVKPPISNASKLTAIGNIAELFGLPCINVKDDDYYDTDFYTDNLHTSHPIAITYAGMALAFERQINQCIVDNVSYFTDYSG